jgi:diaminopimelate epimerase
MDMFSFSVCIFVAFQGLDVDALPLEKIGPLFEYHPVFPARVNTGTVASMILFLVFRFF